MGNTPPPDTHFNRASWLVLLAAILLIGGSMALARYRLAQPDDGYTLWLDSAPAASGLPVDNGLLIVAIDDRSADAIVAGALSMRPNPPESWRIGGTPAYHFSTPIWDMRVRLYARALPRYENWTDIAWLIYTAIGTLVFVRRPRLVVSRVLLMFGVMQTAAAIMRSATGGWAEMRIADLFAPWAFWPTFLLLGNLQPWLLLIHFALVFPRPKAVYIRRRPAILAALYILPYALVAAAAAICLLAGQPLRFFQVAFWIGAGSMVCSAGALLVSLWHGLRHARDPAERAQILWGGLGFALLSAWILALLLGLLLSWLGLPVARWLDVLWDLSIVPLLAPPICIAIAILRYRLFELDLVLNRTLVYGALTLGLAAVLGVVLGGLGLLLRGAGEWPLTILGVAIAGVLVHPLRERLQRLVNRALYGDRDQPYVALARLSDRLGGTIAPDAVLPTIVESVAEALRVPYVAITGAEPGGADVVFTAPQAQNGRAPADSSNLARLPLAHQGEQIGQLVVAPRAGERDFSAADLRLLQQLASQAGAAVHAARLTADLRRSRERLVAAREEERRRLQRDIHDGLGPTLAGLTLKLDAARNLLTTDHARASALLDELRGQIQGAVGDIRRLVHDLRPPMLGQLGLAGAIEDLADQCCQHLSIDLRLPEALPPLSAAAELAVYRIVQEALANVIRHSGARACAVRLEASETQLIASVCDDGRGLPGERRDGVGLRAMRERAEELGGSCMITSPPGGGTEVLAVIPI